MSVPVTTKLRVMRIKQLSSVIGLAKSTIYDLLNPSSPRHDPTFPKPIKLASTSVGWLEVEVEQWIVGKIAERKGSVNSDAAH